MYLLRHFFLFKWLNVIHANECDLHTNQLPTLLRHALDIISLLPCMLYLSLYFVWTKTYMHLQIILKLFILAQLRPSSHYRLTMSSHWISFSGCQQSWNLAKSYIILPLIINNFFLAQGFIVSMTLQLQQYNVGVRLLIVPNVSQAAMNFSNWTTYVCMVPCPTLETPLGFWLPNYPTVDITLNKMPHSRNLASCKICCVSTFTPEPWNCDW